ncbi:MAG TPA: NADH:flavin oxidoreductase/NADH oxidase [Candidatus Acidoferrales bacterium]|jgi:2,4-dienoyl-CoA reductase-like NADH-dependent reductase (Old Yellow Enzyme family)|nr:NADH:flavin oxidoreductase/NADH oxidase [Candidatus Acidoferrales bacterium]
MAHLFEPLTIRGVTLRNRIAVSPMCQYSCTDGLANDWHFVHLGSRAVGGAAIVFCEATAVTPEARISPEDLGIWSDLHAKALARIVRFIHEQGSLAGIQLAHAGRKASTYKTWATRHGEVPATEGGWTDVVAPSAIKFQDDYPQPREMSREEMSGVTKAFAAATRRALDAGFDVVEIHAAHGYLIDEFLSPLSNFRRDEYGGTFENRTRFAREVTQAVRAEWPGKQPLFMRISATDWKEGGWDIEQSVELARAVKKMGVDLMDCSSGGIVPGVKIPVGAGYQTQFAERIRRDAGILTGSVGMITEPVQADHILRSGQADIVLLAREMLRNPYWPLRAARELGQPASWPPQYLRAGPEKSPMREPVKREAEEKRAIAEAAQR